MKTIAYYISDYGFGHATRSIALIRELFRVNGELKVIVCHTFAMDFIKESLVGLNVDYRQVEADIGYVLKPNSMEPDVTAIEGKYLEFTRNWNYRLEVEKDFLIGHQVDVVLSDISPLPFIPASELDVTSIGISNFTWYTAYKGLVSEGYLDIFKNAYEKTDYFIGLASTDEHLWGECNGGFGFMSRRADEAEVKQILERVNPKKEKTIVYFGLGMKIDVDAVKNLKLWDSEDCVFLVSSNMDIDRDNVYKIPRDYTESQHYVAASDIVISKAGWSTVSEAVLFGKPLIVLDRNVMNEDKHTAGYLEEMQHVKLVSWRELLELTITNELKAELGEQKVGQVGNDVGRIAGEVWGILEES
ncbi:glycosyltransferase [Radiobacillus sp. PE A8.2]|uniref:glycosyltransferase n=1 Tax=Radiobacillus sp. PE A8.2 TaxID=3380349 RepID=UPI00388D2DB4